MFKTKNLSSHEKEKLMLKIKDLQPWFHNIEIAKGVYTNPDGDYQDKRWEIVKKNLPKKLDGKECLDVGCSSGFFSLKLLERNAATVIGIDDGEQGKAIIQANLVKEMLELSNASFQFINVYDVKKLNRKFDYVLFLGVLYHLRHPLLALDKLRQITKGKMILQTITSKVENNIKKNSDYENSPSFRGEIKMRDEVFYKPGYPKMYFSEHGFDKDKSNRWLPNIECVTAMLRSSGFQIEKIETLDHEIFVLCS